MRDRTWRRRRRRPSYDGAEMIGRLWDQAPRPVPLRRAPAADPRAVARRGRAPMPRTAPAGTPTSSWRGHVRPLPARAPWRRRTGERRAMKFGIFYEHQLPRPWAEDSERQLIQDALDQVELADRLGIEYVWEVEHHFLEEYSHSLGPRGVPRRGQPAHQEHPPRPRHHPDRAAVQPPGPHRRAGGHARPRVERSGRVRLRRVVLRGRARRLRASTPTSKRDAWLEGLEVAAALHDRDALHRPRAARSSRCRRATSCPSRCRSRTRRCGWRAPAATRSCWPPRRASAR